MWLSASCFALILAVALHGLACRMDLPVDRVLRFLAVGSVVGVVLLVSMIAAYGLYAIEAWAAALCYAFACELYLFLFASTITSISANLLMSLHSKALTRGEVDALYDSRRMVGLRVRRLLATGFVRLDGTGLRVTAKGMRLQKMLGGLRAFFGHRR